MFLLLSAITAVLECGSIFLGIHLGYGPGGILSFCLAYQLGNLFPIPFRLDKKILTLLVWIAPTLLCLASLCNSLPLFQWAFYFLMIALLSCIVQSIRTIMKGKTGTVPKRLSRVVGFMLAPLMAYAPLPLCAACCLIVWIALKCTSDKNIPVRSLPPFTKRTLKSSYCHIMLWHQLHYFIYAYGMILFAYQITESSFQTMIYFACTWLTYLVTEPLLKRLNKACSASPYKPTTIIWGGHTFLLLILLLLPNVPPFCFILLWILTGFGGGTVFAITALCKKSPAYEDEHLELAENIGHFVGTGLAVLWVSIFPQNISCLCYLSALCVVMVIILTIKSKRNRKETNVYENSNSTNEEFNSKI